MSGKVDDMDGTKKNSPKLDKQRVGRHSLSYDDIVFISDSTPSKTKSDDANNE